MTIITDTLDPQPSGKQSPLRVLIVDDSAVTRRLVAEALADDPGVEVVGHASSGELGLQQVSRLCPDVVILDVEMPGMDGLTALKQIHEQFPKIHVLMFSAVTERGAPVTLKALMLGASDYCPKPASIRTPQESREYLRRELLPRIRQFIRGAEVKKETRQPLLATPREALLREALPVRALRHVQAFLIGISTGGPQSLSRILPQIPQDFPVPVLIVQHMPPNFTGLLASRLNLECKITIEEAKDGQIIRPGLGLLAPGGFHMRVRRAPGGAVITLDQEPPENSCRPAVDVLFRSAAEVWGGNVIAAVLTGMGQDGLRGARILKEKGAILLAQDENSSIVWGMPAALANAGLADEILDLEQIIPAVLRRCGHQAGHSERPDRITIRPVKVSEQLA